MLRRRGHPARASVLRAARANRRTSARPGESTSNKCTADLRIELQLDYVHMCRGRLLWRGGTQGALSASPIGAALSRPPETQAGRRVSLRHTQLEGTCRPCTTYSRLASSRRRADGRHGLRRDITAGGAAGVPWCGISPKPAPTQANSSSRRCWICIRGIRTDTRHRIVHRVQLTLSIECLRRLSAVSLRTQWLTTPFRSTWCGLGPHDHACATGGQRGGAERRRCPV
jgi:hypothetical protein